MANDPTPTEPEDSSHINLEAEEEVRYWTEKLGVSRERLEQAIKDHGTSLDAVMSALGK